MNNNIVKEIDIVREFDEGIVIDDNNNNIQKEQEAKEEIIEKKEEEHNIKTMRIMPLKKTKIEWLPRFQPYEGFFLFLDDRLFPQVKWEDKEPTKVELSIKVCE